MDGNTFIKFFDLYGLIPGATINKIYYAFIISSLNHSDIVLFLFPGIFCVSVANFMSINFF